jgi:hypothetical protein
MCGALVRLTFLPTRARKQAHHFFCHETTENVTKKPSILGASETLLTRLKTPAAMRIQGYSAEEVTDWTLQMQGHQIVDK